MKLSPKGATFLRLHEGFVAKYYLDPVGIGTIGIGFTWGSASFREWWGKNKPGKKFGPGASMTREEAEAAVVFLCEREYGAAVTGFLGKAVPQHVFDGSVSPVYNCGPGALKWQWAAKLKAGDFAGAAKLLESTAVTAKGKRLAGLVRRRKEEALLISRGIYTGVDSKAVSIVEDAMADGMLVRGERGPAVAAMLRDLAALGFYDGALDDVFGYGAEAAVLRFQKHRMLKADGYAGPQTLKEIAAAIARQKAAQPQATVSEKPTAPKGALPAAIAAALLAAGLWLSNLPCEALNIFCGG